jgi:hypothetical protein
MVLVNHQRRDGLKKSVYMESVDIIYDKREFRIAKDFRVFNYIHYLESIFF